MRRYGSLNNINPSSPNFSLKVQIIRRQLADKGTKTFNSFFARSFPYTKESTSLYEISVIFYDISTKDID